MKKSVKTVLALMLAFMMVIGSQESFFAAVNCYWELNTTSAKNEMEEVVIPYYDGTITYRLTDLVGECTYLVSVCEPNGKYATYYWMDNGVGSIRFTKKPASSYFKMGFSNSGYQLRPNISFLMYIEHNATAASKTPLGAEGVISYN